MQRDKLSKAAYKNKVKSLSSSNLSYKSRKRNRSVVKGGEKCLRRTFQGRRKELLLTREKVSCKVGRNVRANYFQTLHHHPRRNGEPRGSRSRNPRIEMGTVSLFHDYEKLRIVSSIKKNLANHQLKDLSCSGKDRYIFYLAIRFFRNNNNIVG